MAINTSQADFSSDFRYMRVFKKGYVFVKPPVITTIAHGLSYRPFIQTYINLTGDKVTPMYRLFTNNGDPASDPYYIEQNQYEATISVDDTNINISAYDNTGGNRQSKVYLKIYAEVVI